VSYQFRVGVIPSACGNTLLVNNNNTPLWAYIYHCLRIGDLSSAVSELQECVSSCYRQGEQAALTVVRSLLHHSQQQQSNASDLSEHDFKVAVVIVLLFKLFHNINYNNILGIEGLYQPMPTIIQH
jgi:hypothetical protein